tara:strand:- start:5604 stop:6218 length:615 start_codon:yes stop_codon:yes gene_type:complete
MQISNSQSQTIKWSLIIILGLTPGFSQFPHDEIDEWTILQNNKSLIEWSPESKYPWIRVSETFPFPVEQLMKLIEDKTNYPKIFDRVEESVIVEPDIIYLKVDMPFPFSGRDYVVKYVTKLRNQHIIYQFSAVTHNDIPENSDYVRLVNMAGKWELVPTSTNTTELTYTWNGELLGDFPEWAFERAWITQGNEIIGWLYDALEQ